MVDIHEVLNFADVLPSSVLLFKAYLTSEKVFYDYR